MCDDEVKASELSSGGGGEADALCGHCGGWYCRTVYMGHPGCFAVVHAKGKRAQHRLVLTTELPVSCEDHVSAAAALVKKEEKDKEDRKQAGWGGVR